MFDNEPTKIKVVEVERHQHLKEVNYNLFITRFAITQFWIQHRSKRDPKKCIDYIEK